jgi:hypothetical protein
MESGWHLPVLAPWKALLLLDDDPRDILDALNWKSSTKSSATGGLHSDIAGIEGLDRFLMEARITLK